MFQSHASKLAGTVLALLFGAAAETAHAQKEVKPDPVIVVNTGDEPVPVTGVVEVVGPSVEPVSKRLQFAFTSDGFGGFARVNYEVPEGQRLHITFVTFHDLNRDVRISQFEVLVTFDGVQFTHFLASGSQADNGDVITQQVDIYADPGTTVGFIVSIDPDINVPPGGTDFMYGTFTGTLTDLE